jgi:hypothetical protein
MPDQFTPTGAAPVVVQGPPQTCSVPILNGGTVSMVGTITVPTTIAASGTFTSTVIPTGGMQHIAASAELTAAGTLSVQRFLDAGGVVPVGSASTVALTSGTLATLDNLGTILFQSVELSIINSGTTAATPSNVSLVIGSR